MNPTYDITGQVAASTSSARPVSSAVTRPRPGFAEVGAAVVLADINDQRFGAATDELTASGY